MRLNKTTITTIVIVVFSFLLGVISNDIYLGSIVLCAGILNIWFQVNGKSYNYIFACIYNLTNAYISYKNNLYGLCILSIILYLPLNIIGYITWNKKIKEQKQIEFKRYEKSKSAIIILSSIVSSILFGLILGINSNQKLKYLDSSSNISNIYGIILLNKQLNEGWYVLLFNNIIDLCIWIINFINLNPNSFMMMIVSIFYLIINIYGIYKWKNSKQIDN